MQSLSRHVTRQAELTGVLKPMDQGDALAIAATHQVAHGFEPAGHRDPVAYQQVVPTLVVAKNAQLTRALVGGKTHFHGCTSLCRPSKTPLSDLSTYAEHVKGA